MSILTSIRRTPRLLAAAASIALLGSLFSSTAATATDVDGPRYGMPTVGECHQIGWAASFERTDRTEAIDCATSHNARVIAVHTVPADTDWSQGSKDIVRAMTEYCTPAFYDLLGGNFKVIARTAFTWSAFVPTKAQRSHGARWIRCDVNVWGWRRMLPLGDDPLITGTRVPRNLQSCLMVRKGGSMYSSCGEKHNFEPTKVFVVPGRTEPSRERFLRFAANHCPGRDRYATWRLGTARAYGDHTLTCYRRA